MSPIWGLVVWEHRAPHPPDFLKLLYKAAVSKVAAYRDAVNTLVAEPFQRLAELLRTSKRVLAVLASKADVDVAYGAKHEIRASAPRKQAAAAKAACEHSPTEEAHRPFREIAPVDLNHLTFSFLRIIPKNRFTCHLGRNDRP